MAFNDEELDYGQVSVGPIEMPGEDDSSSVDNDNYDTLADVQQEMHGVKDKLFGDFNTFHIDPDKAEDAQLKELKNDLLVRQGVWVVLEPLIEKVDNAISAVNIRRKQ